jgi:hypothetical protein
MTDRDRIKGLEEIMLPDVRQSNFVQYNSATGESRRIQLEDRHQMIDTYSLHEGVPDNVATQYDVARNPYIYAWFEYRFYPVAEMQALMALEYALRERVGDDEHEEYIKKRKKQHKADSGKKLGISKGMKALIEYCSDHELIRNDQFSA